MNKPSAKTQIPKNKKFLYIAIVGIVVIAASAIAFKIWYKPRINLVGKDPNEIREFFMSEQFRHMDRKQKFEIMGSAFEQAMQETAKTYCSLPVNERQAYLDKLIDEQEARRQEFIKRFRQMQADPNRPRPEFSEHRPQGSRDGENHRDSSRSGQRRSPAPERMRARSERMDPDTRARNSAFRSAMQKRREERGLSGGRGGFSGPPGGGELIPQAVDNSAQNWDNPS